MQHQTQPYIIDDLHSKPGESVGSIEGCFADKVECPGTDKGLCAGRAEVSGPGAQYKNTPNGLQDHPQPKGWGTGDRHEGKVIAAVCQDEGNSLAQGALLEIDIGVGVEDPLPGRLLRADVQSVHLAEPSSGEVLYMYCSDAGVLVGNLFNNDTGFIG